MATSTQETTHDTYVAAVQLHAEKLQVVATTTDAKKLLQAEAEAQIIERSLPALRAAHEEANEAETLAVAGCFAEQALRDWKLSDEALRSAVAALQDVASDVIDATLQHQTITQTICSEASGHVHPRIQNDRYATRIDGVTIRNETAEVSGSLAKILSQLYSALGEGLVSSDLAFVARSRPSLTTESN